jgi:hypothetical protein
VEVMVKLPTYALNVLKLPKAFNTRLTISVGYRLEVNETQT